jgi:hypothetical protein
MGVFKVPRYCLIALIVIVANWLFNPKEAAVIQCSTPVYCLSRTERLIVVDHNSDTRPYGSAHSLHSRHIFRPRGISEAKL